MCCLQEDLKLDKEYARKFRAIVDCEETFQMELEHADNQPFFLASNIEHLFAHWTKGSTA